MHSYILLSQYRHAKNEKNKKHDENDIRIEMIPTSHKLPTLLLYKQYVKARPSTWRLELYQVLNPADDS